MKRVLVLGFVLLWCTAPSVLEAQGLTGVGGISTSIELDPAFPEPNQVVRASLENMIGARAGSDITWLVDGNRVLGTNNERTISLTSPDLGESTTITAILSLPSGVVERVVTTIDPIYLDLVVEPQTHTPHFFAGRSLPSTGSMVNVSALLFGENTPENNLLYTWRINNTPLNGGSERGRAQTSFQMPLGGQVALELAISNLEGEVIARANKQLTSVRPELHFYEQHALYGIRPVALDNAPLIGESLSIIASPYHLDSRDYNNPDVIEWDIDGVSTPFDGNPYKVILGLSGSARSSDVSFRVQSTTRLLQGAEDSVRIFY